LTDFLEHVPHGILNTSSVSPISSKRKQ